MPTFLISPNGTGDYEREYGATGAIITTASQMQWGWVPKGTAQHSIWMMFRVDQPAGTIFQSARIDLFVSQRSGVSATFPNYAIGWLAPDGTWEVQASNLGWNEYADAGLLPKPSSDTSDAAWQGNAATFRDATHPIVFTANNPGDTISFGTGVGTNNGLNEPDFLSKFQDLFDANEAERDVDGVPVAILMKNTNNVQSNAYGLRSSDFGSNVPELIVETAPTLAIDALAAPWRARHRRHARYSRMIRRRGDALTDGYDELTHIGRRQNFTAGEARRIGFATDEDLFEEIVESPEGNTFEEVLEADDPGDLD